MSSQRKRGIAIKREGLVLIERIMSEKGYNRSRLAELAEISNDTVNALFQGERKDKPTIQAIATALELQPTDIVDANEWYRQSANITQNQTEINWLQVCHTMLDNQQEQQRIRRKASAMGFEVNVHVPLGLVERKQQQRRDENVEREQVYQLEKEVITKTYEHKDFLKQVISQRYADKKKHIAIVGEPGAGKTTLLSAIALYIKQKTLLHTVLRIWITQNFILHGYSQLAIQKHLIILRLLTIIWLTSGNSNLVKSSLNFDRQIKHIPLLST